MYSLPNEKANKKQDCNGMPYKYQTILALITINQVLP